MSRPPLYACRVCGANKPRSTVHFREVAGCFGGVRALSKTCRGCEAKRRVSGRLARNARVQAERLKNGIVCTKCNQRKAATDDNFPRGPKSGHFKTPCKACCRRRVMSYQAEGIGLKRKIEYERSDRGRAMAKASRLRNPQGPRPPLAQKAYSGLKYMIETGRMKKAESCLACPRQGRLKAFYPAGHAHLDAVRWLCGNCHAEALAARRAGLTFAEWTQQKRDETAERTRLERLGHRLGRRSGPVVTPIAPERLAALEMTLEEVLNEEDEACAA